MHKKEFRFLINVRESGNEMHVRVIVSKCVAYLRRRVLVH